MNKPIKQFSAQSDQYNTIEIDKHFFNPWKIVKKWYRSELGQELFKIEKNVLKKQLEQVFGYNLIQLGCFGIFNDSLISNSKISNQFIFESIDRNDKKSDKSSINASFYDLPIQSNSIDLMILPHTLEFEANPHQILREVERVLMPEGKVILLSFNPYSLWGLWHKYWQIKIKINSKKKTKAPLPSCGHLISQRRLKDWLQLLGFDVGSAEGYFYRPPLQNLSLLNQLNFMEKTGDFSRLIPAGAYMIVATKRVSTLTAIRQPWRLSKTMMGAKVSRQPSSGFKGAKMEKTQR